MTCCTFLVITTLSIIQLNLFMSQTDNEANRPVVEEPPAEIPQPEVDRCEIYVDCGRCLQIPSCFWCSDVDREKPNCRSKSTKSSCTETEEQPSSAIPSEEAADAKVNPSKFTVRGFVGNPIVLETSVRSLGPTPVDFYFLVDNSYSIQPYAAKIGEIVVEVVQLIKGITADFRVGYGAFIDKLVLPAIDQLEVTLNDFGDRIFCYKNILSLTNQTDILKEKIISLKPGYNYDDPEGSMESLLQAAACFEQLKWRSTSKKMILVLTDAFPHIPIDSKYNYLYVPHDGKCHMDSDGLYTAAERFAYPEFPLVKSVLRDRQITPIFMVVPGKTEVYKEIASEWSEIGARVASLVETEFLKTIVETIKSFSKSCQANSNYIDGLDVSFQVKCPENTTFSSYSQCSNMYAGSEAKFQITLTPTKPISDTLTVNFNGFGTLNVTLDISDQCECNKVQVSDHSDCNAKGAKSCGLCRCNEGNSGSSCECNLENEDVSVAKCTKDNKVCGGKGNCECGLCNCNPSYSGKYCECSTKICPVFDGETCGGPNRGHCPCAQCVCKEGYTGFNCGDFVWDHPIHKKDCLNPLTGKYCDNGECIRGSCVCKTGYINKYCEYCSSCIPPCDTVSPCVLYHNRENFKDVTVDQSACQTSVLFNASNEKELYTWGDCSYFHENCELYFQTAFSRDGITTLLIMHPFNKITSCPKVFATVVSSVSVAISILAAFLVAVILLKIIHYFYKRKEYKNFLKNKNRGAIIGNNPLYGQEIK